MQTPPFYNRLRRYFAPTVTDRIEALNKWGMRKRFENRPKNPMKSKAIVNSKLCGNGGKLRLFASVP